MPLVAAYPCPGGVYLGIEISADSYRWPVCPWVYPCLHRVRAPFRVAEFDIMGVSLLAQGVPTQ